MVSHGGGSVCVPAVLLKRLADLYRSQRGDKYRQMLERFDAEYKAVGGDSKP